MFDTDQAVKAHALQMWANYVETGNVLLSAEDAESQNKCRRPNERISIKALTPSQMKLVIRLRDMAENELRSTPSIAPTYLG